jgi:pilus assembly protein CpaE
VHPDDDYARLPASLAELVLRVQTLALRAGFSLPAAGAALLSGQVPVRRRGQVVVLFGLKGGIGRSTIAANLAVGLAQRYGKQVALVDADLWCNGQAALLDLHGHKNLTSLVAYAQRLDRDMLREVLVPHSAGVQVLLGPPDPVQVEMIPDDLPARVVREYRWMFDFVIVDTHCAMDECVLQLLDTADRILLVTTPEVSSLHTTSRALRLAPSLGWEKKLLLVLNRANAGVSRDQLETMLGMLVGATIVSAGPQVIEAANRGQPLLLSDPAGSAPITRDLARLVAQVAGEPEPHWSDNMSTAWWRRPLARLPWATRTQRPEPQVATA